MQTKKGETVCRVKKDRRMGEQAGKKRKGEKQRKRERDVNIAGRKKDIER